MRDGASMERMLTGNEDLVLIMVKDPVPGKVKCRLAKDVGEAHAAGLYECFFGDLTDALSNAGFQWSLAFLPLGGEISANEMFGNVRFLIFQQGEDLGDRLENAFRELFSKGVRKVVALSSDIPDLPMGPISEAFSALGSNDIVLGPCPDGGYYLIGFREDSFIGQVFQGIPWSSDKVMASTLDRLDGRKVHMVQTWSDVDTLSDLRALMSRGGAPRTNDYISKEPTLRRILMEGR